MNLVLIIGSKNFESVVRGIGWDQISNKISYNIIISTYKLCSNGFEVAVLTILSKIIRKIFWTAFRTKIRSWPIRLCWSHANRKTRCPSGFGTTHSSSRDLDCKQPLNPCARVANLGRISFLKTDCSAQGYHRNLSRVWKSSQTDFLCHIIILN